MGEHFTRISKREARKLWGKENIALCPHKLRPGLPWGFHCVVHADRISTGLVSEYEFERRSCEFDSIVNEFTHYNCGYEAGYYPAYYLYRTF